MTVADVVESLKTKLENSWKEVMMVLQTDDDARWEVVVLELLKNIESAQRTMAMLPEHERITYTAMNEDLENITTSELYKLLKAEFKDQLPPPPPRTVRRSLDMPKSPESARPSEAMAPRPELVPSPTAADASTPDASAEPISATE